jgi:hypothetical protein
MDDALTAKKIIVSLLDPFWHDRGSAHGREAAVLFWREYGAV